MQVIHIDDPDDARLAEYRNIRDSELAARRRLFLAEGRLVVRRLLQDSSLATRSVLVTGPALAALGDPVNAPRDLPVYVVPQQVMNGITGIDLHRGCLALGVRPEPRHWRDVAPPARRLVVLECVGDADNVGSIFRNVAAFGADACLLGPACADPLYRKSIRTSMGASLMLPFAWVEPWPQGLGELRDNGWTIVGMTPAEDAVMLRDVAGAIQGRPVAVMVGNEGDGLTTDALAVCDYRVRIPMTTRVGSLNVATAAAIALYELSR